MKDLFVETLRSNPVLVVLFVLADITVVIIAIQLFAFKSEAAAGDAAVRVDVEAAQHLYNLWKVDVTTRMKTQEKRATTIETHLKALGNKIDRRFLQGDLNRLNERIFDFETVVKSGAATRREKRSLADRKQDREKVLRRLSKIGAG